MLLTLCIKKRLYIDRQYTLPSTGAHMKLHMAQQSLKTSKVLSVIVDYSLSVEEMVNLGKFDWINTDVDSKHFTITGEGMKYFVVHFMVFRTEVGINLVRSHMKQKRWKPAPLEVGLTFAALYPHVQIERPIALIEAMTRVSGSNTKASPRVVCLTSRLNRRDLSLKPADVLWAPDYMFLAVDA